ncbi:hypothetical protein HELRODRAFT_86578 [Helobdella robusta]|uniref:Hemerythrin-like domain-containing protein n=1 Tax=Helobdella robusta TaxID=6412 RepID=T1G6E3_HELRO|nr:hypothetical protein HELRODRAFT_86578 [Helobdella robusta]ESN95560.1 hypothetical protein HELRODRAFT_86578 [Helobdella robusta]
MKAFFVLALCVASLLASDIPSPFQWNESFRVSYDTLDEQHKGLFKGIYDVEQSPGSSQALTNLRNVIETHFRTEEKMMKDAGYSEYDSHRKIHTDFEKDLSGYTTTVSSNQIQTAKEWLVNHIKGIDFKYKGKLSN